MTNCSWTRAVALGSSSLLLLALTACTSEDEPEPQETVTETVGPEDNNADDPGPTETETLTEDPEEAEEPDTGEDAPESDDLSRERIPPGGAEQIADGDLPGDEFEMFYAEGDELGVAGLDPEDAPLEAYAAPSPNGDAEVVGGLEPTDAVTVTGRERNDTDDPDFGIWTEVELAEGYGWVEGGLFYFGSTEDITEDYIGEVPPAEDPQTIAEGVVERYTEPWREDGAIPDAGQVTVISAPEDYGEEFYRVDATGMPDDSGAGARLFVTVEDAGDGYQLIQVERTRICQRGVSDEGLCI